MITLLSAILALQPEPAVSKDEVIYRTVDGVSLSLTSYESRATAGKAPAVLIYHGGGWRWGSPDWMADTAGVLAKHGVKAITVQYRLSEGDVTPIEAYEDSCAALAFVREHAGELDIDASRVAVYGVSAGGQLSARMGTRGCPTTGRPDLMILYSPALRVSQDGWFQRLLGSRGKAIDHSPYEHWDRATPPTFIVSGEKDSLTPHRYARESCDTLRSLGRECTLVQFPGVGHLLTRNLENQESDFDVAPESLDLARFTILRFLDGKGWLTVKPTAP